MKLLSLTSFGILTLMTSVVMCVSAFESKERYLHSSARPVKVSAAQLCARGPGENWHILLTDYELQDPRIVRCQLTAQIVPKGRAAPKRKLQLLKEGVSTKAEVQSILQRKTIEGFYKEAGDQRFFDVEQGVPIDESTTFYTWSAALILISATSFFLQLRR